MKSENNTLPENLFTGKWTILSLEAYTVEGDWLPAETYEDVTWEFTSGLASPRNTDTRQGVFMERVDDEEDLLSRYFYHPQNRELHVEMYDYEDDPFYENCYLNCRYRIEPVSPNELRLYHLKDVALEPLDYKFRLNIIRQL